MPWLEGGNRLDHQFGDHHRGEMEGHSPDVNPGNLEQVLDQLAEAVDVGAHQREGGLGPLGEALTGVLQNLHRCGQSHQR